MKKIIYTILSVFIITITGCTDESMPGKDLNLYIFNNNQSIAYLRHAFTMVVINPMLKQRAIKINNRSGWAMRHNLQSVTNSKNNWTFETPSSLRVNLSFFVYPQETLTNDSLLIILVQ